MERMFLVTNDFPPRKGGIQTYLKGFARELDPDSPVVYRSSPPDGGADKYDAAQPWTTIYYPGTVMLPILSVRHEIQRIIREQSVEAVWLGVLMPLGLVAKAVKAVRAGKVISTTHGYEVGWARVPAGCLALRKIFHDTDVVTYLAKATLRRLRPFIGNTRITCLPGGISPEDFAFSASRRHKLRARYGTGDESTIVYISRLVERKGQNTLIRVRPWVLASNPRAKLVIAGKSPYQGGPRKMAQESSTAASIAFTGKVPPEELATYYSLGDVFAMPCRTRVADMDLEGLGIVRLEAYAAGLPVAAGDSGSAPEAVINGKTSVVYSGHRPAVVAFVLAYMLDNPSRAKETGRSGLAWADEKWRWSIPVAPLREELLTESQKQALRPNY